MPWSVLANEPFVRFLGVSRSRRKLNELSKMQAYYDDGEAGGGSAAERMTISTTRGFGNVLRETDGASVFGCLGDDLHVRRKDATSLPRGDEEGEKALTGRERLGSGGKTDSRRRPGRARLNGRGRVYLYTSWRIDKLFSNSYQEKQPNRKTCPVTDARFGAGLDLCPAAWSTASRAPFPFPPSPSSACFAFPMGINKMYDGVTAESQCLRSSRERTSQL